MKTKIKSSLILHCSYTLPMLFLSSERIGCKNVESRSQKKFGVRRRETVEERKI
jgi:hypothetical protein